MKQMKKAVSVLAILGALFSASPTNVMASPSFEQTHNFIKRMLYQSGADISHATIKTFNGNKCDVSIATREEYINFSLTNISKIAAYGKILYRLSFSGRIKYKSFVSQHLSININSRERVIKVLKAFQHLKRLCNNSQNDLF